MFKIVPDTFKHIDTGREKIKIILFSVVVLQVLSKVNSFILKLIHFPLRLLLQTYEA